jgi:hypothetical protein
VTNSMILRVPNYRLDSILKTFARFIDYLDYRTIEANDVTIEMMSYQRTQDRVKEHEQRLKNAIDDKGKKLHETENAEENLYEKGQIAENAHMANQRLQDQIDFSTVNLIIYQRQQVKHWMIANEKNIDEYKPGFGRKVVDSLKFGWKVLESVLVFIVKLWGLILLLLAGYILIARYGYLLKIKRKKS